MSTHNTVLIGVLNPGNKRASMFGATYDLLEFHVTVIVILHENQRSTSLLGLSRPQFSENYLTKADTRGPWSDHATGEPMSKEMVSLPATSTNNHRISTLSNWFWLTDWQIDYSDPRVDPTSGWQYAKSFNDDDASAWTPVAPTSGYGWVRRRRWVRVMKRRMDLTKGSHRGENVTIANDDEEEDVVEEAEDDYLLQADIIVQSVKSDENTELDDGDTNVETLKEDLQKYQQAVEILTAALQSKKEIRVQEGITNGLISTTNLADGNEFRKHQASTLVRSYMAHIDRLNIRVANMVPPSEESVAVAQQQQGLTRELEYIDPNEEAHENIGNPWANSAAAAAHDEWSSPTVTTPPQRMNTVDLFEEDSLGQSATPQHHHTWESDKQAKACRICERKFGLLLRRHHCRKCGLVVCDKCSPWKVFLNSSEILQDPEGTLESLSVLASQQQRVCEKCYLLLDDQ